MSPAPLLATTARALQHRVAVRQREARVPSLVAGVVRDGALVWMTARGRAVRAADIADTADAAGPGGSGDAPALPTADTQYRIGSITKTMVAALVMLLHERGALDLDDDLDRFLPGWREAGSGSAVRLRDLLSHGARITAEPHGPWWERHGYGDAVTLRGALTDSSGLAPVLPAGGGLHYSNLGYALLGQVVETVAGEPWTALLQREVLDPLAMTRTTYHPVAPHADGLAVHDLTGRVTPEPAPDTGALAPAGQLWSTLADLATWTAALVDPARSVLSAASLRLMATPQAGSPEDRAGVSWGLGLTVSRRDGRALVGHGGSMPGFAAQVLADRDERVGVVVLSNAGWGLGPLAVDLLDVVLDAEPAEPAEWWPTVRVPAGVEAVVGLWHWGEAPHRLWWDGELLRLDAAVRPGRNATFRPTDDPTVWVGASGYFDGETLRAQCGAGGEVRRLWCATFEFTRRPYDRA